MTDVAAEDGRRGCVAAAVGGITGAASGAWIGWALLPLLGLAGDPDLGSANLAFGLAVLTYMVGGGMTAGALVGIGAALRVAGHHSVAATLAAAVVLSVAIGAVLVYLAAPLAVAAPLLAAVPATARWLMVAILRHRAHSS